MRELRQEKGWSLSALAGLTRISAGQVGNLEHGRRWPTAAVAAACDKALGAEGELVALASLSRPVSLTGPGGDAGAATEAYSAILGSLRAVGRECGPRRVLGVLVASAQTLGDAAAESSGARARETWLLASRFAEYAGWMWQESGNHAAALSWTSRAVAWGERGGDEAVAAYALVRRAMISQHRGDPRAAVEFARCAAAHRAATPRIRAHAARREAQGHALLGDTQRCMASLDRCAALLGEPADEAVPAWGPQASARSFGLIRASCLVTLRLFADAVEAFNAGLGTGAWPASGAAGSGNAQARFRARQAAAYMGLGHGDIACALLIPLLPAAGRLDSATLRAELGLLLNEARNHEFSACDNDVLAGVAALIRHRSS
jgi:hypothetical protein